MFEWENSVPWARNHAKWKGFNEKEMERKKKKAKNFFPSWPSHLHRQEEYFFTWIKRMQTNWTFKVTQSVNEVMHKNGQKVSTCMLLAHLIEFPVKKYLGFTEKKIESCTCVGWWKEERAREKKAKKKIRWTTYEQNSTEFMAHVLISSLICSLKRSTCTCRSTLFHPSYSLEPVWMVTTFLLYIRILFLFFPFFLFFFFSPLLSSLPDETNEWTSETSATT